MWCTEEEHAKLERRFRTLDEFVIRAFRSCRTQSQVTVACRLHKLIDVRLAARGFPMSGPTLGIRRGSKSVRQRMEEAKKEALNRCTYR